MILLTGNAGFIGRYMTDAFIASGDQVVGIDIRPRTDHVEGLRQVDGNILDEIIVRRSMEGAEVVVHLAAEHKDFGVRTEDYYRVNVEGTKALLQACGALGIKKFFFFSSVAVYGAQSNTNELTVPQPNNHYGKSKLLAEAEIHKWIEEDPTRSAMILRPAVVFGPRNRANIFRLIRQVCDKKFIQVGTGENIKSIAFVRNVVDATQYLMNRMAAGIQILNYADTPHLKTKEIVALIAQKTGIPAPTLSIPEPLALAMIKPIDWIGAVTGLDLPITSERIRKYNASTHHNAPRIVESGFVPRYSIADGIRENVEWYLNTKR